MTSVSGRGGGGVGRVVDIYLHKVTNLTLPFDQCGISHNLGII